MPNTKARYSIWHKLSAENCEDIRCQEYKTEQCFRPAEYAEYMHWHTGNTSGVSFFYYCEKHALEQKMPGKEEKNDS